ncbi:MAG: type II toxin-antitoxin system VapC family toxin [Melioribacteraceae bacterium]|nr:type II toxin-antitoxin system VapC family toxin [Melioribacteraceae bacterium]MCF8353620.1 type II toxin-antitoxin system VapC family toxin [Melioribacteraceae bacterium]MCF8393390.1 type II toxin-antitoxin system VapC family toxin [Melioribacteraceae bacterium]MCF8419247.1 type II toxin-antitoxin system VapC family toxin [Melioribacteraceae bacterium]
MNLSRIPKQQTVIIDTNILFYANQRSSLQAVELLERCAAQEIFGIVPVHILAELIHIFMMAEARDLGLIKGANPAKQLSQSPNKVKSLYRYEGLIKDLLSIGLQIETIEREDFYAAISIQRLYGILTNDALLIAVAQRLRVSAVASADKIFEQVKDISLYKPGDLKI